MKTTRTVMGMPATIELVGGTEVDMQALYGLLDALDARFSTYIDTSEVSRLNRGEVMPDDVSDELAEVLALSEKTRIETDGYFSITRPDGFIDPSGMVKGWAIQRAAALAEELGIENYFIDIGGDIQSKGVDATAAEWTIGIRNPFAHDEIVKVVVPRGQGVATSGTAARGQHIYNPHDPVHPLTDVVSITVIGPNVYEADRFATAAFAMGRGGVTFINARDGLEAYMIDKNGIATMTSNFQSHTL